jgi:chaperone required for assembly of F1-ATPase
MRDLFADIFPTEPLDPVTAARHTLRPHLRRRFYAVVDVAEADGGFCVQLDGRPVRTPARRIFALPTRALADALASEWRGQVELIDPANMPLTRLANSIIDGVADTPGLVAAEIEKYLESDLVFYRAASPQPLAARQAAAWDPLVAWARGALGAEFLVGDALAFIAQPEHALAAARAAIPRTEADRYAPWQLGALHSITTLTGSALIALSVLRGRLAVDDAWAAAHVDEDWNMEQWGRDAIALERRATRFAEMQAAATVLRLVP